MKKNEMPANNGETRLESSHALSRFHRLLEPPALIAGITLVILAVAWGATLTLVDREKVRAERAAAEHVPELADTYEARMLRALRQIDNTLDLVHYSLTHTAPEQVLQRLRSQNLMPLEFIFNVSLLGAEGDVIARTGEPGAENVGQRRYFREALKADRLVVGQPRLNKELDEWRLSFSRSLRVPERDFTGVVTVSAPLDYFVSGYQSRVMGKQGVLALVGTDGIIRARNNGERVRGGDRINYEELTSTEMTQGNLAPVRVNQWDGVARYTSVRKLYGYPLAIVVGLSRGEQLAPVTELRQTYFKRTGVVSLLIVIVMGLLARLTLQLQKARVRVVEEREARAQQVEYLAFHDELTKLPNRSLFSQVLVQETQKAQRYNKKLALLFLDLDGFKAINDSLGHDAGDDLLREVSRRLTETLRSSDVIARLGGDEFVILLPEIQENTEPAFVAQKILDAVGIPFAIRGHKFRVSVSIGIALFPDDHTDQQTLMKSADLAMYHAKEGGKNNFRFYSADLNDDSLKRLTLESELRTALEKDEFRLFYQAKRDMRDGSVVGMEALLRWDHPDNGLTEPMEFIPQAEENGLILPIGRWVLSAACQQNVAWQKAGFPPLSMAVNLSARQFVDNRLVEDVQQALRTSGMEPELLELEITESMIIPDMQHAIEVLAKLKDMGVRIAIDDFGTAYSSLSSLRDVPLDTVKIDQSWVRNLDHNPENQSLTQAVITVGRNLSLTVIAEGVESWCQADFLRTHMCEQFQGFYINEPVPPEEFAEEFSRYLQMSATSGSDC